MHSKIKGGIGVLKVAQYFVTRKIPVFSELLCDVSEIDLIIEVTGILKTIQVRTTSVKNGSVELSLIKTTPGTRNKPCKITRFSDIVDLFALYVLDKEVILFVDSEEVKNYSHGVYFNFSGRKHKSVRNYEEYLVPSFLT